MRLVIGHQLSVISCQDSGIRGSGFEVGEVIRCIAPDLLSSPNEKSLLYSCNSCQKPSRGQGHLTPPSTPPSGPPPPPAAPGSSWRAARPPDRKSTRLNSSHVAISYAVF